MALVEKRYAEALVNISVEKNMIEKHQEELGLVADLYSSQENFKNFLLNPETDINTRKDLLRNVFKGRIQDEILSFLLLLLDKGRIKYLQGIFDEYVRLAEEKQNILSMDIMAAAPLQSSQVESIKEKFRRLYKASSVKASVIIDESLVGGVRVQIGDKLMDGSIKGRLKELQGILLK
jgi:F-type H+-transporting ATPase subunit delta